MNGTLPSRDHCDHKLAAAVIFGSSRSLSCLAAEQPTVQHAACKEHLFE
jgi:hypothetical protein